MSCRPIAPWTRTLVAAAAALAAGLAQAVPTVTIVGPPAAVTVGEEFTATLVGQGFMPIFGGGVDLDYNEANLDLLEVHIDSRWEFFSQPGTINHAEGTLSGLSFNTFSAKGGDLVIAQLTFRAIALGNSTIHLSSNEWPFSDANATIPTVGFVAAAIPVVSAVPEPATWLLLAAGAGWLVRRRPAAVPVSA